MEIRKKVINEVVLTTTINDREYNFHCERNAPAGEIHDVLMNMKGIVVDTINKAQQEEKEVSDFVSNKTDTPPEALKKEELVKEDVPKEEEQKEE